MTDWETRLVDAARRGDWLVCTDQGAVVRAELIRELLLGRHGDVDPRGVRLSGALVEGTLDLDHVTAVAGLHLSECVIHESITAAGANLSHLSLSKTQVAGIDLVSARIAGDLVLRDVEFTNTVGPALNADRVRIDGCLIMLGQIRATGHSEFGVLNLIHARIASAFELRDAELVNNAGPALMADNIRVGDDLIMRGAIRATGHGQYGAISMLGADITGDLRLEGVQATNTNGPGVRAHRARVSGNLVLLGGTRITGHGRAGALNLIGVHVSANFQLRNVEVANTDGPAVAARRMQVHGQVALEESRLSGNDLDGAVDLAGARVGGSFGSGPRSGLRVDAGSGLALNLSEVVIGNAVAIDPTVACPVSGLGKQCRIDGRIVLNDLSFASLGPGWTWEQWLHVIRRHTFAYHAAAYQRLAAVERAAGHDGVVRRILMAQQTDLRLDNPDDLGGFLTRRFHWLWGVLAGYGFRARRIAAALLVVLAITGALGWFAGQIPARPGHLAAERVNSVTAAAGVPCSTVELVGLGLDRGLPLAMTGMRARCDLDTASHAGQAFTAAIWLVQLAVWGLATLALAGYTNLVRKPG